MDNPIVIAMGVFIAVYILFFLVRVLADMYIVGITLLCAVAAYHIPQYYNEFVKALTELNLVAPFGIRLSASPDTQSVWIIAVYVILGGLLMCLPVLPFSATYRYMLGVDRMSPREEYKIRQCINEEFERIQEDDDD